MAVNDCEARSAATICRMSVPEATWADGVGEVLPVGLRFELFVDDVGASVNFYASTLGLAPPHDWSADGYVALRSGAVTIGVQHHGNLPAGHQFAPERLAGSRGVGLEIVIEVDDVDRVAARARRHAADHGGRYEPLSDQPWGLRDFRLVDPDGYYLRITSHRRDETASVREH